MHPKKQRKLAVNCADKVQGDYKVLPYRLVTDILEYAIVQIDISYEGALFQLIGRFGHDVFRTPFLIFRSVYVYYLIVGDGVSFYTDSPESKFFLPYVIRPDQFICVNTHPKFWYKIVSMLKRYDPTNVNLREVHIRGPLPISPARRKWAYVIHAQLLRPMSNLRVLHLSNVVLTNEVRTVARHITLCDVRFTARFVAPQCTALWYTGGCKLTHADFPVIVAPLVTDLRLTNCPSRIRVEYLNPTVLDPHERFPDQIVQWTEGPLGPSNRFSSYKIADFAKIVRLSIALPYFDASSHSDLVEFVSLQHLSLQLAMCCCILLPRHEIKYVNIRKGYADYSPPVSHFCTYCGEKLQDVGIARSHVHGTTKSVHVVKFSNWRVLILDDCPGTEKISFAKCNFIDTEDTRYKAERISAVSCSGLLRVDCDFLQLDNCPSLRWEGKAICECI